jgi:hypothetical protein
MIVVRVWKMAKRIFSRSIGSTAELCRASDVCLMIIIATLCQIAASGELRDSDMSFDAGRDDAKVQLNGCRCARFC